MLSSCIQNVGSENGKLKSSVWFSLFSLVDKCTKLVKARDAERLRERDEEEASAEAGDKASSDENKENEDTDDGPKESQAVESDKPGSKLDGGVPSASAEKMD